MDFSSVCRTCLDNNSLNPIFKDSEDCAGYSSAIYVATGVQVQLNDGLPQNMCVQCVNVINNTLKFRKQCQNAQSKLYRIKSIHTNVDETTIIENDSQKDSCNTPNLGEENEICIKTEIYCKTEYESESTLRAHADTCAHKNKKRKVSTAHCGESFGNKRRLSEHGRARPPCAQERCSFTSANVVALRCGACGARFKANNSLHAHRRACHGAQRYSGAEAGSATTELPIRHDVATRIEYS